MTIVRRRLSRLPLRVRLVAGFSAVMLVVLLAAGGLIYWRVQYALDRGLDTELASATQTLGRLVRADGTITDRAPADATGAAWQVLDESGDVLDRGGPAPASAMVPERQVDRADDGAVTVNVGDFLPISHEPYRIEVSQVPGRPGRYLLAGVRRDHRDEALRELLVQLALAGLGALLITAFVGDRLARAALRPVERYRREAAAIASGVPSLHLDVPPDRDDEVTRLGHTLNDMLTALDQALDRERQFVNEASHELRTPITLLTSRVQLARRRQRTIEEYEHVLDELTVDLDRLALLASHLLELSSVSAQASEADGDLAPVVERVVRARHITGAEVTAALPDGPVPVRLPDLAAERIITNLLDNAAVHGAPPVELTVDIPHEHWVRIAVADAGEGMPPALLESAVRRFARADEARSRPGAGLGLSLVDSIVSRAHGELRLCSRGHHASHGSAAPVACQHDGRTTVTVLLPRDLDREG